MITQDRLKEFLNYDPDSGIFTWAERRGCRGLVGVEAGYSHHQGYIRIGLDKKQYAAHRLAFIYMNGFAPRVVDHVNGNKSDNRWVNLRPASITQNCLNAKSRCDNTSGIKGVTLRKNRGTWEAAIQVNKSRIHVGNFKDIMIAQFAIMGARCEHHGEFANHG